MSILKRTEIIQCPKCGKKHTVDVSSSSTFNLDASYVRSLQKHMQSYVLCDCGTLCWNRANKFPMLLEYCQTPKYQQILHNTYASETEHKLLLLWAINNANVPTWLAHYYYQQNDANNRNKWLRIAIEQVASMEDNPSMQVSCTDFKALKMPKTAPFSAMWFYNPEFKLIDLYRQLGDFKTADRLIQEYIATNPRSEIDNKFLNLEMQLVKRCDSAVY